MKRIPQPILRHLRKFEKRLDDEWKFDYDRDACDVARDIHALRRLLRRYGHRSKSKTVTE